MKRYLLLVLVCLSVQVSISQSNRCYLVKFTDKEHTPYSVSRPSEFLSEKAIARRTRQHIVIDKSDLPVDPAYVAAVKNTGVFIQSRSRWMNAVSICTNDQSKIGLIKALPFVKEVILTADQTKKAGGAPAKFEKPGAAFSFSENRSAAGLNYGPSIFQVSQIGVDCMHNNGYLGQGMTIAVLDAGFYKADSLPAFDSLRNNGQLLGCRDMIAGDTMVFEDWPHGMNVLSCIAGYLPGQLIGTAPKAKFWLIRTEDAFSETLQEEIYWLQGAEFADSVGADIINSSLGYSKFDSGIGDHYYSDMDGNTTIVTKAADWAASKGILVSASAGNSGGPPWFKITAPADADSVMTVGAVDSAGAIANFSGRGLSFDGRIKPDVCARGVQATIAANFGGTTTSGGTSFSSPLMAGAAACLWQSNPSATNMQVIQAIRESGTQYFVPDSIQGYGIPNICMADSILSYVLSVDDHTAGGGLSAVYPNPFSSSFQVSFYMQGKEMMQMELFDLSGRKVLEKKAMTVTGKNIITVPDVESLAPGAYILAVRTTEHNYFEKIIKQ